MLYISIKKWHISVEKWFLEKFIDQKMTYLGWKLYISISTVDHCQRWSKYCRFSMLINWESQFEKCDILAAYWIFFLKFFEKNLKIRQHLVWQQLNHHCSWYHCSVFIKFIGISGLLPVWRWAKNSHIFELSLTKKCPQFFCHVGPCELRLYGSRTSWVENLDVSKLFGLVLTWNNK